MNCPQRGGVSRPALTLCSGSDLTLCHALPTPHPPNSLWVELSAVLEEEVSEVKR